MSTFFEFVNFDENYNRQSVEVFFILKNNYTN